MDWLIYYGALSRVSRDPTEFYKYELLSVLYLILLGGTKIESHYHYSTEDVEVEEPVNSKRMKITVFYSLYTTCHSTNKNILRRTIILPNVQYPFYFKFKFYRRYSITQH